MNIHKFLQTIINNFSKKIEKIWWLPSSNHVKMSKDDILKVWCFYPVRPDFFAKPPYYYKCRCAGSYRAIFRYSSAKVAKTAEMYVYTPKNCTKILPSIICKFVLYIFGKDTAAYHCVWSALIRLSLGCRENGHRRFVYYFCHTLMEIAVFMK